MRPSRGTLESVESRVLWHHAQATCRGRFKYRRRGIQWFLVAFQPAQQLRNMKLSRDRLAITCGLMAALEPGLTAAQSVSKPPNFLFIMADDQDLKLDSLSYMPFTTKHMQDKGMSFVNHFVTTALCCPSRVSLLTGRQAHNTNVTDVHPPWGKLLPLGLPL